MIVKEINSYLYFTSESLQKVRKVSTKTTE